MENLAVLSAIAVPYGAGPGLEEEEIRELSAMSGPPWRNIRNRLGSATRVMRVTFALASLRIVSRKTAISRDRAATWAWIRSRTREAGSTCAVSEANSDWLAAEAERTWRLIRAVSSRATRTRWRERTACLIYAIRTLSTIVWVTRVPLRLPIEIAWNERSSCCYRDKIRGWACKIISEWVWMSHIRIKKILTHRQGVDTCVNFRWHRLDRRLYSRCNRQLWEDNRY